jgi:hypothetical protein
MKRIILLTFPLLFTFCTEVKNNFVEVETEKNKLFLQMSVGTEYLFTDSSYQESLTFNGNLLSQSNVSIDYLVFNTDTIWPHQFSILPLVLNDYHWPGYVYKEISKLRNFIINPFEQGTFKLKTKLGSLEGAINMPNSIYNNIKFIKISNGQQDTISANDTIYYGEGLKVQFNGNADFYRVEYHIHKESSLADFYYEQTKEKFLLLDTNKLNVNGDMQIRVIHSVNGPYPEEGSVGNMNGQGTGFLYCVRKDNLYDSFHLVRINK